ncbi:MAG TPA: hypothetical protein VGJ70_01715, partial [Solirubrobacteraceae bacterium]
MDTGSRRSRAERGDVATEATRTDDRHPRTERRQPTQSTDGPAEDASAFDHRRGRGTGIAEHGIV